MINEINTAQGHSIPLIIQKSISNSKKTACILVHGIFTDKSEKGRFDRLSNLLLTKGCDVYRFDFRGHGDSKVDTANFDITGAVYDFSQVVNLVVSEGYKNINIIGSSFGGSVVLLYQSLPYKYDFKSIVLLNPVIDYIRTFTDADLDWGRKIFSTKTIDLLLTTGKAKILENFEASVEFYNQLLLLKPYNSIPEIVTPMIVFHGNEDDKVSYLITEDYFGSTDNTLDIVRGAGHAFKSEKDENYVHEKIGDWLFI